MAMVAGGVHGVISWQFDHLAVKIAVGLTGALVLIMAGAISARQAFASALALGVVMGLAFFMARWAGWSLMDGGIEGLTAFATTPPWGWPGYLEGRGISGLWVYEAVSMFVPALLGCYAGQERVEA